MKTLLVGASYCMLCYGTLYSFPIWLPDLKTLLGLNQASINIIGILLYVGAFVGMIVASIALKFGLAFTMRLMGILDFAGYISIWAIVQFGTSSNLAVLCMLITFVIGIATGIGYSTVLALLLGIFGVEWNSVINAWFSFLYGIGGVAATLIYYLGVVDTPKLLLVLAVVHAISTLSLMVFPNILAYNTPNKGQAPPETDEKQGLITKTEMSNMEALRVLVRGADSWTVLIILFLMLPVGTGFTTILGNLTESLDDGSPKRIGEVSFMYTLLQTGGRMLVLPVTLLFKKTLGADATLWLSAAIGIGFSSISILAHFYISANNLYYFAGTFAVCYGAMWSVNGMMYSFVSLDAGKHIALIMACVNPITGVGSIVLNTITGVLYDRYATNGACVGKECFSTSLLLMGIIASPIVLLTVILPFLHNKQKSTSIQISS